MSDERETAGLVAIASAAVAAAAPTPAAEPTAAAAPAAEPTAPAATAAAAEPAPTTAATAATAIFARACFVDGEGAAAVLLAVQRRDCGRGLVIVGHLDEPETLAPAGVPVVDVLGGHDLAVLPEELLQLRAIDAVAQVADVQLLTHCESPLDG